MQDLLKGKCVEASCRMFDKIKTCFLRTQVVTLRKITFTLIAMNVEDSD